MNNKNITKGVLVLLLVFSVNTVVYSQIFSHKDSIAYKAGVKYLLGVDCSVDYKKARDIFRHLMEKGYADASAQLGYMTQKGYGCEQNKRRAFYYFKHAHDMRSLKGSFSYASCLRHGEGVEQNYERAFAIYDSCANLGYQPSLYKVGEMLYKGYGCEQNYDKAVDYFKRGAEKGDRNCMYMLGVSYVEGTGVEQSLERAKEYMLQAMIKGHGWVEDVIEKSVLDSVNTAYINRVEAHHNALDTLNLIPNNLDVDDIQDGYWNGNVTLYDWSGKYVAYEIPTKVKFTKLTNDTLEVEWKEYVPNHYRFKLYKSDGRWCIKGFAQESRFSKSEIFKGLQLGSLTEDRLCGVLYSYSNLTKDRRRPSYFELSPISEVEYNQDSDNFTIARIYPNPFKDRVVMFISMKEDDLLSVELYDMYGHLVYNELKKQYKAGDFNISVNLSGLKKGSYLVRVKGQNTVVSRTLIKKD